MFSKIRVLFGIIFSIIGLFSFNLSAAEEKEFKMPDVPDGWEYYHDVEIGKVGKVIMTLDIVAPKSDPGKRLPVVCKIHGGGWKAGNKNSYAKHIARMPKKGYIGVSIAYRFAPEYRFPAQVEDVKLAIRYLRANKDKYFIDADKIGVWGASAGGHLASMVGTTPDVKEFEGNGGWNEVSSKVACVVNASGPVDFTTNFAFKYGSMRDFLGVNPKDNPELARKAMPVTYASKNTCPFLILHGDQDKTIPISDSESLYEGMKKAGVPVVSYNAIEGGEHSITGNDAANKLVWAFFDEHLKGIKDSSPKTKKETKKTEVSE